MNRRRTLTVVVAVCLGVFLALPSAATAWTASSLSVAGADEDRFYTYDFESSKASVRTCDWPVTIIFWGNASVAKVKQALSSSLPISGNTMYAFVADTTRKRATLDRVSDSGVKSFSLSRALHVRVYADADGRLTNATFGNYVIATTHLDLNELSANPVYGYSEQAAAEIEALCASAFGATSVQPDVVDLHNPEPERADTRANAKGGVDTHVWQCDGLATLVYVP